MCEKRSFPFIFAAEIGKGNSMIPFITVRGGRRLSGEITVCGMKNAALPILFASILVRDSVTIENLPPVTDIQTTLRILAAMGARVDMLSPTTARVNAADLDPDAVPPDLTTRLRGSSYLLGACLGRFGRAFTGLPGGCDFGVRPLDQHFRIFTALGAECEPDANLLRVRAPRGLRGAAVRLSFPSVGATLNGILAAATAEGTTVIENAAREPHVADLAAFLNACGADISGAGTSEIRIHGAKILRGCRHAVIPDMIEAGTYMAAVAGTGGRLRLRSVDPAHLAAVSEKLTAMGAQISASGDRLTLCRTSPLLGADIEALPYPLFPTDMQPQFAPLLCLSSGGGRICEHVWESRFRYVPELCRMGAEIRVDGRCAFIRGGAKLTGADVAATDLRAGAAMVIAGLCAGGSTRITGVEHIDRGYPDLEAKLQSLGADVRRVGAREP